MFSLELLCRDQYSVVRNASDRPERDEDRSRLVVFGREQWSAVQSGIVRSRLNLLHAVYHPLPPRITSMYSRYCPLQL
jgi:hypothetical protein